MIALTRVDAFVARITKKKLIIESKEPINEHEM